MAFSRYRYPTPTSQRVNPSYLPQPPTYLTSTLSSRNRRVSVVNRTPLLTPHYKPTLSFLIHSFLFPPTSFPSYLFFFPQHTFRLGLCPNVIFGNAHSILLMLVVIVVVVVVVVSDLRVWICFCFFEWRRRARWLERSPHCLVVLLLYVARLSSGEVGREGERDGWMLDWLGPGCAGLLVRGKRLLLTWWLKWWIGSDVNTLMKEASVVPNHFVCLCCLHL